MTSALPSILNFRDVGKTINSLAGKQILKEGQIFRSARPDEATQVDRDRLLKEYGIKTIIDLRTKTEHIEQAKARDAKVRAAAASPEALPVPDAIPAGPLQIPGISYHHLNFNGRAYANTLLAKLTWRQYLWVIGYMATGYRKDAIKIIAGNVMIERKLTGLATDSMDACTAEVKEFFDTLASEKNVPVLVHCTQGKDRTGLTILLLQLLCDVPLDAAEQDYMMSQNELESERAERVREIESIGLPDWFADCDPAFVKTVNDHVRGQYGGIMAYLGHCGIDWEVREKVKKMYSA